VPIEMRAGEARDDVDLRRASSDEIGISSSSHHNS
jgi:hypothetical protein